MNMLKKYWNEAYLYIFLLIYGTCTCAAALYTIKKSEGLYPDTPWSLVLLFDLSQIIYHFITLAFILYKKKATYLGEKDIVRIKLFITTSLFIQYNFVIHLFPDQNTWSCTFIFMGFVALLFDTKLMLIHTMGYVSFLILGHLLYFDQFLPQTDSDTSETILFRSIVVFFVSVSILSITNFAEKFLMQAQEQESENIFLMEKQLEYYQNCDLLDKELRKFRHDIKGHFIGMGYLLKNKSYEELSNYFTDLNNSFSFHEQLYFSGNLIIDSILNYDIPNKCGSHVQIEVSGKLHEITTIPSIDLCTVFSNLLSNAIKAVNQCNTTEACELSIHFDSGLTFFSITIVNSIPLASTLPDSSAKQALKKSPMQERNHGYGIKKIREICKKYNGSFEQSEEEQKMLTTVYLPL